MKQTDKIKGFAMAGVLAAAVGIPVAFAQSGSQANPQAQPGTKEEWHGRHQGRGGRRGMAGMGRLNLSDTQKTQLKQLRQSFGERTQTLRKELQAKRQELRQAGEGGSFNEALATQKLTEMASLEAKMMGERFKLRQEMVALLTPEQKAQFDQAREQFKNRRQERRNQ